MALDTARNRFGMLLRGLRFPTGVLDAPARIELLARYPGIAFGVLSTVASEMVLVWEIAASANRIARALEARGRAPVYRFAFERRTVGGAYIDDVTPAFMRNEGEISASNDRDVFRSGTFVVRPGARDRHGNPIVIDPKRDVIAVRFRLLVDGEWWEVLPLGLFVLVGPRTEHMRTGKRQEVTGWDVGFLLANASTPTTYRVASGTNYVTAAQAVVAAANADLRTAFQPTTLTTPTDMSWPPGTPYLRILTGEGKGLLDGINYYQPWADRAGVLRSGPRQDLATRTPDVLYDGATLVRADPITEEGADIHYTEVIAVVDDPERAPITAFVSNDDPMSPVSTVSTGRRFTRVIRVERAVSQGALEAIASEYLRSESYEFVRAEMTTVLDPRRDGHEVYGVTVDGVFGGESYRAQSWTFELRNGGRMVHQLRRTAPVTVTVAP